MIPHHRKTEYHVLLVDDDPLSLLLLKKVLEKGGHVVTTADNGQAALDRLRHARYDLVVLDGDMPVMDGYECAERIRKDEGLRGLAVILLSGQSPVGKNAAVFDRTLSKPIDLSEFLAVVEETAANKTFA